MLNYIPFSRFSRPHFDDLHCTQTGMDDAPTVFQPRVLRHVIKYRCLRKHNFSMDEKLWACKFLVDSCGDMDHELMPAVIGFCDKYDIKRCDIVNWLDIYSHGEDYFICSYDRSNFSIFCANLRLGQQAGESAKEFQDRLLYILHS